MAYLIENDFSSYNLTEEETAQGSILTITQKQVIQNDIAICAQEKINLEYDSLNPQLFMQQEAKLAGQLQALRYRLECSETAEEEILFKLNNPEASQ